MNKGSLKNRVIFFSGYPGSGKGTQAKKLATSLDLIHLSTGELFRKEAKTGSEIGLKMASYMEQGQIIPQDLTFDYLRQELSKEQYRKGIIIDGYPKDLDCYQFILKLLSELQFIPWLTCHFCLPRKEVEERLLGRLHCKSCELDYHQVKLLPKVPGKCDSCEGLLEARLDDTVASISKRLDVFEQNTQPVLDEFDNIGIYQKIDAAKVPDQVFSQLLKMIQKKFESERSSAYFSRPPRSSQVQRSQVFHNHIDAESEDVLLKIVEQVEHHEPSFWNKIYPIHQLTLGPQGFDPEFSHLYDRLPNFHEIGDEQSNLAVREAFATGKMGLKAFDYQQIRKTLAVCGLYKGRGVMTELEQEIFSSDDPSPEIRTEASNEVERQELLTEIEKELGHANVNRVSKVPKFELHHGFDVIKKRVDETCPLQLEDLIKILEPDFCVGGWFIFRKANVWAFRSNEFANGTYEDAMKRLKEQSALLNLALVRAPQLDGYNFHIGYSLENVMAIWSFDK